jgi:hypothetical protein
MNQNEDSPRIEDAEDREGEQRLAVLLGRVALAGAQVELKSQS